MLLDILYKEFMELMEFASTKLDDGHQLMEDQFIEGKSIHNY